MRIHNFMILLQVMISVNPVNADDMTLFLEGKPNTWIGMISPIVVDLENDDKSELVIISQGNTTPGAASTLFIFEASGVMRCKTDVNYSLCPRGFPTVIDTNNDGIKEIIVEGISNGTYVLIFDNEGNLISNIPVTLSQSDNLYSAYVINDINNNGREEIIYGAWSPKGSYLSVLELNGSTVLGFSRQLENLQYSEVNTPAVGNLDSDTDFEIVLLSHRNNQPVDSTNIWAFDTNGDLLWNNYILSRTITDPVIGDVDNDGSNEIIFTAENGIHILNSEGDFELQNILGAGGAHSNIALADLDQDLDLEIVFGYRTRLYAMHHDGNFQMTYNAEWYTHHPPIIGDINDDDIPEILFNCDNDIYALDVNGHVIPDFPLPMNTIAYSSPSIADIDNDGDVEIISSASCYWTANVHHGIVYIWDLESSYDRSEMEWPMYQHDVLHTGNYNYNKSQSKTQHITTHPNMLNLISFNVLPDDPDVISIFNSMENLVIVFDDDGNIFIPPDVIYQGHQGSNTIGMIDPTKAYSVFYTGDVQQSIDVFGSKIDLYQMIFNLQASKINKIAFPGQNELAIDQAFSIDKNSHIYNHLEVIYDDDGGYFIPPNRLFNGHAGINTIEMFQPGKGYCFYHNDISSLSFTYLSVNGNAINLQRIDQNRQDDADHFTYHETGVPHFIFLQNGEYTIDPDDELAVFAGEICVGATKCLNLTSSDPLVIWQAVPEYNLQGIKNGDLITLFQYSKNSESIAQLNIEGEIKFNSEQMFSVITILSSNLTSKEHDDSVPSRIELQQNYPNPFNNATALPFILNKMQYVSLSIYNINGKLIKTVCNNVLSPGEHVYHWDGKSNQGTDVASGIYWCKLKSDNYRNIIKMIVIR